MPGQKITKHQIAALSELGEERVFAKYLEVRSVKKLLKALGPAWTAKCRDEAIETEHDQQFGIWGFYKWLDAEEGRRERWRQARAAAAEELSDEVLAINDRVTDETVRVEKLKSDNIKWWAAAHNPGLRPGGSQVTVNQVTLGELHLQALKEISGYVDEPREVSVLEGDE